MYVARQKEHWDVYLPHVTFAYNTSKQQSTKHSPFFLVYGRSPRLPIDRALATKAGCDPTDQEPDATSFVRDMQHTLRLAHTIATKAIAEAQEHQKQGYDQQHGAGHPHPNYKVGQLIWLKNHRNPGKFDWRWNGPYKVSAIQPPNVTITELGGRQRTQTVHLNRIKHCHGDGRGHVTDLQSSDDSEEFWTTEGQG